MEWQRLSHLPIEQQTLVNNQRQQAKLGSTIVLKVIAQQFSTQENLFKIQVATLGWLLAELGIPWRHHCWFLAQFKPTIETILAPSTYTVSLEMIWPKPTMLFYQRRLVKPCRHI